MGATFGFCLISVSSFVEVSLADDPVVEDSFSTIIGRCMSTALEAGVFWGVLCASSSSPMPLLINHSRVCVTSPLFCSSALPVDVGVKPISQICLIFWGVASKSMAFDDRVVAAVVLRRLVALVAFSGLTE
jgi:hypothetical protein